MPKRMITTAMAVCVLLTGLLVALPARAADDSNGKSAQSWLKSQKAERKARKAERKAERQQRHENREGILKRLWPFGKDKEEEQASFPEQRRFGTGNPRDASGSKPLSPGEIRPLVEKKVRSHKKPKRDGMHFVRKEKTKKKSTVNALSADKGSSKRYDNASHSHKNGEFRKISRKQRHRATGLNWNLPKNVEKINKKGAYRPNNVR